MPTAAKLMAAICFAIIGWFAAEAYIPGLPDNYRIGNFLPASAGLGVVIGWLVLGPKVSTPYIEAIWRGISTSVYLLFWALVVFSIHEMLRRSLDKRYDHPIEALTSAIEIGFTFFKLALSVEVLGILALGGAIAGLLVEFAHRRWR